MHSRVLVEPANAGQLFNRAIDYYSYCITTASNIAYSHWWKTMYSTDTVLPHSGTCGRCGRAVCMKYVCFAAACTPHSTTRLLHHRQSRKNAIVFVLLPLADQKEHHRFRITGIVHAVHDTPVRKCQFESSCSGVTIAVVVVVVVYYFQ